MSEEQKLPEGENEVNKATAESEGSAEGLSAAEILQNAKVPSQASAASSASAPGAEAPLVEVAARAATVAHAAAGAGSDAHGHDGHDGHDGHAHVSSLKMLVGVLVALVILTVMTVTVTMVDLGAQWNFVAAMIIATVKAALVMGFFMHLIWESKFTVVAFLSSFLFVILFLSMALLDRQESQPKINEFEAAQKLSAPAQ